MASIEQRAGSRRQELDQHYNHKVQIAEDTRSSLETTQLRIFGELPALQKCVIRKRIKLSKI